MGVIARFRAAQCCSQRLKWAACAISCALESMFGRCTTFEAQAFIELPHETYTCSFTRNLVGSHSAGPPLDIARWCEGEIQLVSGGRPSPADRAAGKLHDGVRGETRRYAPRRDIGPDFLDAPISIQVDEIDGELHAEGMDSFAWNDPKAFAAVQVLMIEKTPASARSSICDGDGVAQLSVAGTVQH